MVPDPPVGEHCAQLRHLRPPAEDRHPGRRGVSVGCGTGADYSVYTMRQVSRRSWRIGQTAPIQVVSMAYLNTLQADALKLVAKKLQSSFVVEREHPPRTASPPTGRRRRSDAGARQEDR